MREECELSRLQFVLVERLIWFYNIIIINRLSSLYLPRPTSRPLATASFRPSVMEIDIRLASGNRYFRIDIFLTTDPLYRYCVIV